jgi:uncharacterized membrane protein SpoIIM required for sporulation
MRVANLAALRLPLLASGGAYLFGTILGAVAALSTSAGQITPDPAHTPPLSILGHNLSVLVWLAVGLVSAGVITMAVLVMNGMLLGWVMAKELAAGHGGLLVTGILPHLPLELGGYLLSAAVTLHIAVAMARNVLRRRGRGDRVPADWRRWAAIQAVCVALLAIAALVEAYVSHA